MLGFVVCSFTVGWVTSVQFATGLMFVCYIWSDYSVISGVIACWYFTAWVVAVLWLSAGLFC